MAMVISEQEFCLHLVRAVEKHECLYNFNSPDYSKKDMVEHAWHEISKEVHVDVPKCRTKWRNIRTVFMRHLKIGGCGKKNRPYYLRKALQFVLPYLKPATFEITEETSKYSNEFDFFDFPSYCEDSALENQDLLDESEDNIITATTVKEEELSPTLELDVQDSKINSGDENYKVVNKKLKLESQTYTNEYDSFTCTANSELKQDPKRAFLISLLPDLATLNNKEMRQFKRKVLEVVDEIIDGRASSSQASSSNTA